VACALCFVVRRARAEKRAWLDAEIREAPADVLATAARLARTLKLRRVPSIRVGSLASGPALIGMFRPVVVLPESFVRTATRRSLEHVLLHELAHAKRRDPLAHAAWTIATCVYWFHPCVWLAAKRAALLREIGCDELAARRARGGASGYRRTLLELARPLARGAALSSGFTGGAIVTRLALLERPLADNVVRSRVAAGALFAFVCLCCVPLGRATTSASSYAQFTELQGCMRKRLFVMAELAKEDAAIAALHPR
jgi:beta-lactamase regulating signal transducer with metallopeptidase domain